MDLTPVLYIFWLLVLPALAIFLICFFPIFWFIIVPKLARTLTWARFRKCSILALADDSGWAEIVPSKKEIPEGLVNTPNGWFFFPRPRWKSEKRERKQTQQTQTNPTPSDEDDAAMESVMLRKYILKGMGKPFWFGYASKVTLVNPGALASLEETSSSPMDVRLKKIQDRVLSLPESLRQDLPTLVRELKDALKVKPINVLDPRKIKRISDQLYPPSQIEALETFAEAYGMKLRGKEYGKLIIGLAAIIGLVILGIIVVNFLFH